MIPLGDFAEDAMVDFKWPTNDSDGASITRAVNGTISVYKGNNDVESVVGVADTEDFDGVTGVHHCRIDTSAHAFYEPGEDYQVVLSGATIDGQTVNTVIAHFSIENRSALRPTTAGRTLDVAATGEAGVDLGNVTGTLTQANVGWVDANSRVNVGQWLDQAVTLSSGNKPDINVDEISDDAAVPANLEAMLDGTGAVFTLSQLVISGNSGNGMIDVDNAGGPGVTINGSSSGVEISGDGGEGLVVLGTSNAVRFQGAGGYGLGVIGTIDDIVADITGTLATCTANTDMRGTDNAALAATALSTATWTAARAGALTDWIDGGRLDNLLDAVSTHNAAAVKTAMEADGSKVDHLWEMTEDDGGVRRLTTNALEQAPGGGLSAQQTRDAMKLDASGGGPAAGSVDQHLDDILTGQTDIKGTNFVKDTHSLIDIKNGQTSSTTHLLNETTITVADQTHFTLAAGSADDAAYYLQVAVLIDQADGNQVSIRKITVYVGASKTVTLDSAPDFTIVNGDTIRIFAVAPGTTAPTVAEVADGVWDEAKSGHKAVGSFGEHFQAHSYPADASVLVELAATDADRGANLIAAYNIIRVAGFQPGGAAKSASNRARVLMPPGRYLVPAGLNLDANFADLEATEPEMGGPRMSDDLDVHNGTSLDMYRPPKTEVYCETVNTTTVEQSAANVWLKGFAISQLYGSASGTTCALRISCDANTGSVYEEMYFWHRTPDGNRRPVGFAKHVQGVWKNCKANACAWRVGRDGADEGQFSPTMYDCEAGAFSFVGDFSTAEHEGTHKATNCLLVRCRSIGKYTASSREMTSGAESFAGCIAFGMDIDSSCVFIECEAGDNSFGLGHKNEGTFIRCRGGDYCFAATTAMTWPGEFAGYAEDCFAGAGSFGGRKWDESGAKLTGTLIRCKSQGSVKSWQLEGATIEDCLLTVGTTGIDCLTLLDNASRVTNSTVLVVEGGTGIPINAGSAMYVCAAGNRYNNSRVAKAGLGSYVVNVGTEDLGQYQVGTGSGSVSIDHNYGGIDALSYVVDGGTAVEDALVQAYFKSAYDTGSRTRNYVKAEVRTGALGRWETEMRLEPGTYTLVYYKQGEYGPDIQEITVT